MERLRLKMRREAIAERHARFIFRVTDTGIGMTAEQMGRLFQAFTQADASTTRNYGGTGLGLTISKHFCTMLGGTIDVTSEPGKGSNFTIVLPDAEAESRAAGAAHRGCCRARFPPAMRSQLLVVDDDASVHDLLAATLEKEGYRLLHAYDGEEAIELARSAAPDVITLDVMMPHVDGWSVLGQLKSEPETARIPVIMLTIVDERTLGYSLGASEFMTKPVDRARLVALVQQFAGRPGADVVLIVDDQPEVRAIVRTTITGVGLKAAEADNGQAALDWLAQHPQAGADAARSDDAGDGRLRVSGPLSGGRDPRGRAGRGAHRARSDRERAHLPGRAHHADPDQGRAAACRASAPRSRPSRGASGSAE